MTSDDLEKRRFGLGIYLRAMSSLASCWESPLAREFLCVGGGAESSQANTASHEVGIEVESALISCRASPSGGCNRHLGSVVGNA